MDESLSAEAVVQRQLDAYNARDIEGFMSAWAEDAEYFEHPSTLLARGSAQIRDRHVARFKEPDLHGALIKRMVAGNMVVDQERVTRTFPEGKGHVDVIAIYRVQRGRIAAAWFIVGPRTMDEKP